jgi:hypothetical protein
MSETGASKDKKGFRALEGQKIVAGGNAPGKRDVRPPDPEGVARLLAAGRKPVCRRADSTLSGSDLNGATFSGGVAPGYCIDPLRGYLPSKSE